MKKETLSIMVCPVCRGTLAAKPKEETDFEIISGNLYCSACDIYYPIEDKIANMLPPELRDEF
ncbi:MAG: methytransferase partner Trm112 [Methanimicrococcus sp.]|nr:methytransferase partner Trm112 [Methanimicrococcus sp.]